MKVTTINKNIKDNRINFKVQVAECDEYSWFDNGFYFGWVDKDLSNYYVAFIDEQENKRVVLGLTDKEVDSYRVQGQRPCGRGYSCGCEYGEEIYQHGYDDSLVQELLELGSIL